MGKRRKPVRKPNYEDIGKVKQRMSGEAIPEGLDSLLADIRFDDQLHDIESDALRYLRQRRPELIALAENPKAFEQAAYLSNNSKNPIQAALKAESMLDELGELQGNVPMPIQRSRQGGGEYRTHTQYRIDPVTQQRVIAPVYDIHSLGEALKSTVGVHKLDLGYDKNKQADEVIAEYALKLMHPEVENMPFKTYDRRTGKQHFPADFKVTTQGGERRNIDSQQGTLDSEVIPMQTHTQVAGVDLSGYPSSVAHTQKLIEKQLAKSGNVIDAVDDLADAGKLASELATKSGKIIKGDLSRQMELDDRYHELIMPDYSESVRFGRPRAEQPRNVVTAPDDFTGVNLGLAARAIKQNLGGLPDVVPNAGGDGKGRFNHKVNVDLRRDTKVNGESVFTDLTEVHPLIQQLLSHEEMKKRGVN